MSVNSTSSVNTLFENCINNTLSTLIIAIYGITRSVLVLPLLIPVVHTGIQRWRKKHSFTPESHSDIITYHSISLEVIRVLGFVLLCLHPATKFRQAVRAGQHLHTITWYGQNLFHALTCVERYLAAVHPITYMGLKNERGVRIRNISIGCAWLLTVISSAVSFLPFNQILTVVSISILVSSLLSISLCSLSVLRVLLHHGPGDAGQNRDRVDQTKQRAFYTIMAIWAALLLRFSGLLFSSFLYTSTLLGPDVICVVISCVFFLDLPSCLLLPLMYLQRTGKLPNCCHSSG